jgi:hypothetical protein
LGIQREEIHGRTLSDLHDRNPDSIRMRTAFELTKSTAGEQADASAPFGGLADEKFVNVLQLNLALRSH